MKKYLIFLSLVGLSISTTAQTLKINEVMQSNVECIMDDIKEFPDSWVELYNPTDAAINLKDYKISNKNKVKKAYQLPDQEVPAAGYAIIYCDKEEKGLHTSFRLESAKGCTVYLFKGNDAEPVDSLPADMKKMPAPDVAFGRETDGADKWGYQLTPTPGKANTGKICDAKHILGAPVFGKEGFVTSSDAAFQLELNLPEGAPEGTVIRYTTDGSEPTSKSTKYTSPINIGKTKVIRAKLFCDGWLSPMSSAQSYIFHPREITLPIFSVQTNDKYLNDKEIGLFANNKSKEDKKTHDWRRPVMIEFFPVGSDNSAFNQLGETRIQGGQSRSNALKSMVFYANKRFNPDQKRYSYEFFPDQKPGITEFKSFSLRDGGNDFGDLYFRDLIIQRTMAGHVDLDWQAGHSAGLYINGEYMGMLNIRERSNEDNIYSNYNGLEDIDMVEISHEQENGQDMFIEEFKGSEDATFYNAFKAFYSEKGHTKAEYEQWMDVSEYLNIMIMNLFYGNIDFPGNNIVFWRPNDDDTESGLPKIWRFIVKDTDFGLGLYNRQNNYNTIDLLYHPEKYPNDNWAFTEPATLLIKNMLEDKGILDMFIDKCCVYMGDFMNGKGTGETIDLIKAEAMEEFVAHRDKYNSGWGWWGPVDNRSDIENKFNAAKQWAEGRPNNFYKHIGDKWNLGTAFPVTINKTTTDMPEDVIVNGIKLSEGVFDGKLFPNRQLTVTGKAPEDKVMRWKVVTTKTSGSKQTDYYDGDELVLKPTSCKSMSIEAVFGTSNGIDVAKTESNDVKAIYNLRGERQQSLSSGVNIVVYDNGTTRKVVK